MGSHSPEHRRRGDRVDEFTSFSHSRDKSLNIIGEAGNSTINTMTNRILFVMTFACAAATAQTLPTIRVSSETAPIGGMAQMKVLMTSPMPIITGNGAWDLSQVSFDSVDGINLFSPTGDVAGAAVVDGHRFSLRF